MEKYHFIGIGGIGMSGLAKLLIHRNKTVSGSDLTASKTTESLLAAGATVYIGQSEQNIDESMTVVYSTDIKKNNPEYVAAVKLNCPMLHRSELLQKLIEDRCSLAVAGTHGKTTTSSLLTWVLSKSGQQPSFAVGGIVPQLQSNAGHGTGTHFVLEACESDGTFLNYKPFGAIVTNVDSDHMDFYGTSTALENSFKQFMSQVSSPNHLFWCGDDHSLSQINSKSKDTSRGISYGFSDHCQLRGLNFVQNGWSICFDVEFKGHLYSQVEVSLVGRHNALNALAVFGLAMSLGLDESLVREALKSFGGVLRRCEKKGESHGILFIDDYGHHPTEIKATLKAIRGAISGRRLVVIYQPHRYSRAKECIGLYGGVFLDADALFVTEIYASREQPIEGVTHERIISEIQADLKSRCQFIQRNNVANEIINSLRPHDVVVTLGAGDVTSISSEILKVLKTKAPPKLKVGVICGGASVEHEVSLRSVEYILKSMRPEYYEVEQFYINRQGQWLEGDDAKSRDKTKGRSLEAALSSLLTNDIIFPVLHGTYGEDGTIQGMLEMFSKAYVGCDYRSAAISMDKGLTKTIAHAAGIATSPFIGFNQYQWKKNEKSILEQIQSELVYPLFVKPSHLGSSVGVHKVIDESCLITAIENAFTFDTDLIVENGIDGREIEFSVLGNEDPQVFPPGEILSEGKVYDYANKYGENGMKAISRAEMSEELVKQGMAIAKHAYEAVGCMGMARVDTFLDHQGKFWLNEINPIPGFTEISLFPQMCAANGVGGGDLIDRLIILGLQRRRQLNNLSNGDPRE